MTAPTPREKPALTAEQVGVLVETVHAGCVIHDIGGLLSPIIADLHRLGALRQPDPSVPRYVVSPLGYDIAAEVDR